MGEKCVFEQAKYWLTRVNTLRLQYNNNNKRKASLDEVNKTWFIELWKYWAVKIKHMNEPIRFQGEIHWNDYTN